MAIESRPSLCGRPQAAAERRAGDAVRGDRDEDDDGDRPEDDVLVLGSEHAVGERGGDVVQRADPADAEPGEEQALAAVEPRADESDGDRKRPDQEQEHGAEQPPAPARLAEPGERDHAPEQEDDGELAELLGRLRAPVNALLGLVVALVAPKGDPGGERGEEAVCARELGDAVDDEHGSDRHPAVQLREHEATVAQRQQQCSDRIAAAAPIATPTTTAYTTSARIHSGSQPAPGRPETKSASTTNGKARPSLSPASAVTANLVSLSSSSPGGPTPMSPASTGSVGASALASRIAAASGRPITQTP